METPDGVLSAECACHNDRVRREITVFRREKAPVGDLRVEQCHLAAAQRGVFPGNGNAVYEERNCDECSPSVCSMCSR